MTVSARRTYTIVARASSRHSENCIACQLKLFSGRLQSLPRWRIFLLSA